MPPEKHAVLSASSAERWMHCPGSVALTKDMPDTTSVYAEQGRCAHALAELKLRKYFVEPLGPRTYKSRYNKIARDKYWAAEMDKCTDDYLEYVKNLANGLPGKPFVTVEHRVDYSEFAPDGFGTSDCILIYGSDLYVIDYKHGAGVLVDPADNPQMMLYALGAVLEFQALCDIKTVHMTIVQPRAGGVKEASMTRDELMDWAVFTLRPAAQKAHAGSDEYHGGPWCHFCKAYHSCRESSKAVSAMEDFGGKLPPLLTDAEVGEVLKRIDPLIKYADAVKAYAEKTILQGGNIPGWKLVEGRGSRAWDDQAAAFDALKAAGIDEALLYERKPLTAPALEKALGKKAFAEVAASHVVKQPGKPALAPDSDPRDPYSPRPSAAEDFKQEKGDM